jgi:hypothetical protein
MEPESYYCVDRSPPLVPILCQMAILIYCGMIDIIKKNTET